MIKIKVIVVGKTKEKYLQLGESDFQRRLTRFCQLEYTVVKEEKVSSNMPEQQIKQKEAERIFEKTSDIACLVALDQTGKQMSSIKFAEYLQQKMNEGCGKLAFIIGGALGLDSQILNAATDVISLSEMTFTHEMTRLIFMEQLYRAFTILKGEKYHK